MQPIEYTGLPGPSLDPPPDPRGGLLGSRPGPALGLRIIDEAVVRDAAGPFTAPGVLAVDLVGGRRPWWRRLAAGLRRVAR